MRKSIQVGAFVVGMVFCGLAQGVPIKFSAGAGATNHWYEFVNSAVPWTTAQVAAEGMTLNAPGDPLDGATGHLVTLASGAEGSFVFGLTSSQDIWIGLTDSVAFGGAEFGDTHTLPAPSPGQTPATEAGIQNGEGWVWVTGEAFLYANWSSSEPNNLGGAENYAAMSSSIGSTLWTDRADLDNGGRMYVVEYSVIPEPACTGLFIIACAAAFARRRHG